MIWFYSDPHFGHEAVIGHVPRPYASAAEMDADLVARYAATVADEDEVFWLGDAFFCNVERAKVIMRQLPGRKILVRGNHDRNPGPMLGLGFDVVAERMAMEIGGHPTLLCHYPYASGVREGDRRTFDYPAKTPGWALVHGHTHAKHRRNGTGIHVGVDAWDYAPVPYLAVQSLVRAAFNEAP